MKKNILIFGLIAGLVVGVYIVFLTWWGEKNLDSSANEVLGYTSMVIAFSLIFVGVKNFRDKYNQGVVSFGKALTIGLGITLIASTIYVAVWLVDFYIFNPDFMDKYADHLAKLVKESGVSQAVANKKMAEINFMRESYKSPVMVVLWTYLEIVPVGIVISLLTAVLLKRKRRPAGVQAVALSLFFVFGGMVFLASCGQPGQDNKALQAQVDSLQRRLNNSYSPGLGEFMSGIQVHHEKLWFAGIAQNWKLANFEVGEIRESLDDIQRYCIDRPEVNSVPMILPAMDSVGKAVEQESLPRFKGAFILLTNTCNNCHQATKHEFNVIRIPEIPPFSNQVFTKQP